MRALAWAIILSVCHVSGAGARTWQITFDPANPVDRIGQIVAQASSGDSIVVGPGTYYEHIDLQSKSLSITSTAGREATFLDGSQSIAGRHGSIIFGGPLRKKHFSLSGFTLRGGTGAPNQVGTLSGGAVCIWNQSGSQRGQVAIRDCAIAGNAASQREGYGGGVYLAYLDSMLVENCRFENNEAFDKGGSLYIVGTTYPYQHIIQNCEFIVGSSPTQGSAAYICGGPFYVSHNRFTSNGGSEEIWGLDGLVTDLHLVENEFIARGGTAASRVRIGGFDWSDFLYSLELRGNCFYAEPQTNTDVLTVLMATGAVTIVGKTLIHCRGRIGSSLGQPMLVSSNLFFHSPMDVWSLIGGSVTCNDAWPDSVTDSAGNFVFDRDISVDPQLCGEDGTSFDVAEHRVCVDGSSPEGCGWIGAGRIGCGLIPTIPVSWGRIKALFHDGMK